VLPLATGLAALLLLPEEGSFEWRDAVVEVLLVVGVMSAGTGVPMVLAVALVDLVRRGWRITLGTVALPAVLYGAWYLQYSDTGLPVGVGSSPQKAPKFVWEGVTGAFADVARIHVLGYLAGIAVAVWLIVQLTKRPVDRNLLVPGALALSGVVLLAMTGWRRGNLVSVSPTTSRYAYLTVAFLLPLTAMAAQHLFRGSRARRLALVVVAGIVVVAQVRLLHDLAQPWATVKQQDRGAVLATAQLVREGHPFLLQSPLGSFEPQMTVAKITELDREGKLESLDHATLADRLTVLARLAINPTTAGPLPGAAPTTTAIRAARGATLSSPDPTGDCRTVDAKVGNVVRLSPAGPTTLRLEGEGRLVIRLEARGVRGQPIVLVLDAGHPVFVQLGQLEGTVAAELPPGKTVVCGLSGGVTAS
jgi:hypothetical protein